MTNVPAWAYRLLAALRVGARAKTPLVRRKTIAVTAAVLCK